MDSGLCTSGCGSCFGRRRRCPSSDRCLESQVNGEEDIKGAATLATEISLGSSEQWMLMRYLTMDALEAVRRQNLQPSRHRPAK